MITIRHLIDSNMRAFTNKTLGAFLFHSVRYDYGDGCHRCALGVCLDEAQLAAIVGRGHNVSPLRKLIMEGLIQVEDEALFRETQTLHDRWAMGSKFLRAEGVTFGEEIESFLNEHQGKKVDGETFTRWLTLLDQLYPAVKENQPDAHEAA